MTAQFDARVPFILQFYNSWMILMMCVLIIFGDFMTNQYFDDDVSYANYVESTSCSLIGREHATQVTYALGTLVVCKYTIINIRS